MALPPTWTLFGDDHLPHRLQLLARMIDRESARQIQAQSGLSLAEWRVLAFVGASGRATAAEICAAFEVDRAEVSRAITRLTDAKLIQREEDRVNRKRLLIELTELGGELYMQTRHRRVEYFREILADLSGEEQALLAKLLHRVALTVDAKRS